MVSTLSFTHGAGLFAAAFAFAVLALTLLRPLARVSGLVDRPDSRKRHEGEIPLVGGLAIWTAFALLSLWLLPLPAGLPAFLLASGMLLLLGVTDDLLDLPARYRLGVQLAAGLVASLAGGVLVSDLGLLVGDGSGALMLGLFALPFTLLCFAAGINAFNMADGLDGLAGGLALVSLAGLAVAVALAGQWRALGLLLLLAGALAAFLLFNLRSPWRARASVFLGDSGSMFLGFALTWFLLGVSQGEQRAIAPVTALWLVALPLFDMASVMLRRVLRGRSPFVSDREHFHHVLLMARFTQGESVGIMVTGAALLAAIGLAGQLLGVPEAWMLLGFLCLFAAHFFLMLRSWRVMRFLHRQMCRRTGGDRRRHGQPASGQRMPERRRARHDRRARAGNHA